MSEPTKPLIPFHSSSEALAGSIYGIVTAMAVIAALANKANSVWFVAIAALGTALALSFTYIYAHWLAGSYSGAVGHAGARKALLFELPTLGGAFVLGLLMLIEGAAGVGTVVAAESAMWVGTALLFVLGYRISLQGGRGYRAAIGFGFLDAMIGASLVFVKVLVH